MDFGQNEFDNVCLMQVRPKHLKIECGANNILPLPCRRLLWAGKYEKRLSQYVKWNNSVFM